MKKIGSSPNNFGDEKGDEYQKFSGNIRKSFVSL